MEALHYLYHRASFIGVPPAELHAVMLAVGKGKDWLEACHGVAKRLRGHAKLAERSNRKVAASQLWRWAAATYQAASFVGQANSPRNTIRDITRLRRIAQHSYKRGICNNLGTATRIRIGTDECHVYGYLRRYPAPESPLVVLFNGLDSLCEVELHSFGSWMLRHGISVLAFDLPAAFCSSPRRPRFDVENLSSAIANWAESYSFDIKKLGAFGVSFGGYLVARLVSGNSPFRCGVAVSPPAYFADKELEIERLRRMVEWSFALDPSVDLKRFCSEMTLKKLKPPTSKILVLEMEEDQLFGHKHIEQFHIWAGEALTLWKINAEHVGTSQIHYWLPDVCDWMYTTLCVNGEVR